MEKAPLKLSAYKAYSKDKTDSNIAFLKGEIYEAYCYDKLIEPHPDIRFFYSHQNPTKKSKEIDGFYYSKNGRLIYRSNGIDLGEFDVLGIKGNDIFWWEVTRSQINKIQSKLRETKKKSELLNILFPKMRINFSLILPYQVEDDNVKNITIIPEPNYEKLLGPIYQFNASFSSCISIEELSKKIVNYDYIQDIIDKSDSNFKGEITDFDSNLFERIYDLDNIFQNKFNCYDIKKKCLVSIEDREGNFYKNGEYIQRRKATYLEIKEIRKKLLNIQNP